MQDVPHMLVLNITAQSMGNKYYAAFFGYI